MILYIFNVKKGFFMNIFESCKFNSPHGAGELVSETLVPGTGADCVVNNIAQNGLQVGNGAVSTHRKSFKDYLIKVIDNSEAFVDRTVPNIVTFAFFLFISQDTVSEIGKGFDLLKDFIGKIDNLIDDKVQGGWLRQLTYSVGKLPFKIARNVIRLAIQIMHTLAYTAIHPLNALAKLARLLVNLVDELSKFENWSLIGAGMIGSSFGHTLVSGDLLSVISLGIGTGLMISGLTLGSIQSAIYAEDRMRAVASSLQEQLEAIPMAILTGFVMGALMGGIQRTIGQTPFFLNNYAEAKVFVDDFLKKHGLPNPYGYSINQKGVIFITWEGDKAVQEILKKFHGYYHIVYRNIFDEVCIQTAFPLFADNALVSATGPFAGAFSGLEGILDKRRKSVI